MVTAELDDRRTIKPIDLDDARLATGEKDVGAKSMLTFPTSEMVTVVINDIGVLWFFWVGFGFGFGLGFNYLRSRVFEFSPGLCVCMCECKRKVEVYKAIVVIEQRIEWSGVSNVFVKWSKRRICCCRRQRHTDTIKSQAGGFDERCVFSFFCFFLFCFFFLFFFFFFFS
ncbi:hypothetical protein EYC84_000987 [Monilinia fructicola]|uniref:Transmembrane protein n=1 Tax=Monilinia fructicola TaxID=38448 RepID=A0A5M9JQX4_MONFR|nr:hypothetical protein EYC84_000987 [Monilinia fructicola]